MDYTYSIAHSVELITRYIKHDSVSAQVHHKVEIGTTVKTLEHHRLEQHFGTCNTRTRIHHSTCTATGNRVRIIEIGTFPAVTRDAIRRDTHDGSGSVVVGEVVIYTSNIIGPGPLVEINC